MDVAVPEQDTHSLPVSKATCTAKAKVAGSDSDDSILPDTNADLERARSPTPPPTPPFPAPAASKSTVSTSTVREAGLADEEEEEEEPVKHAKVSEQLNMSQEHDLVEWFSHSPIFCDQAMKDFKLRQKCTRLLDEKAKGMGLTVEC